MIKNIIVLNDYNYIQGGASLVAIETANILYECGYNVIFFCGLKKEETLLNKKIKVFSCCEYDSLSNPNRLQGIINNLYNLKAKKMFIKVLSNYDNNDTIIWIHGWTKVLSSSFLNFCYKNNFKTILTAHDYFTICPNGGLFNFKKNCICCKKNFSCFICNCDSRNYLFKIFRNIRFFIQNNIVKFNKKINYLVTISNFSENILKNYFKSSKIFRIYNPILINEKSEKINVIENDFFIFVGRIEIEKGIDVVCKTFSLNKKNIYIIGDGKDYFKIKNKYQDFKNIIFKGWQNHDNVLNYMKKSKILIFPSLWYEAAPLTILEALSQGLPCMVSKFCAAIDFVDDRTGWIFDPYSNEIDLLINNLTDAEINEKSKNSYDGFWKKPFTKTSYADNIKKMFIEIEK